MADLNSNIVITAKDATSQAFASVNTGLLGLSSSALKATSALSAIGAGTFVASVGAFTRATIDAQDKLFKLSQTTGVAVESLAGLEFAAEQSGVELEKVARATRVFRELVVEAADSSSGAAKKLEQLGLRYKDLKDLSPEKQLLALSDALSKFSKDDRPIAFTSVFGDKMAGLIPLLSNGSKELSGLIEQGKKLNPVTEASARQSERFNDQLNLLNKSVSSLGREFVQGMIPGLTAVADRMVQVTQQSGALAGALAGVKELFVQSFGNPKILGDVGQIRREIFKTQEVINGLEKKKGSFFFDENALQHEKDKLASLQNDLQGAIVKSRDIVAAQDANTASTKKFSIAVEEASKPLVTRASNVDSLTKKMSDQSRIESEYVKLLKIERQAQQDLLKPYQDSARSAQERLDAMQREAIALDLSQRKQISLEQAIELTTIARLEEKRAITKDTNAVAEIEKEIAARKNIVTVIQQSETRTKQLATTTQQATDQVSQLWMQAGRNIQSSLANGIFNFFDDGLKGMVKNVADTVGRILSEFAALKLAQSIGLNQMFGLGGTGGTGGASNALNIASIGANAGSFFKSGFGIPSTLGSIGGSLPGSAGAFFSGMGGTGATAARGAQALWGASGLTGANAMGAAAGSAMATAAGPLLIAYLSTQVFKSLAGDKRLGGGFGKALNAVGDIPILGDFIGIVPLLNGLFGRGPYKFRQQSIQGTASASGLDGEFTNVFRAKGGLFRSNGHKSIDEQFTLEQQTLFDDTLKGFYGSAREFAENLGLSTSLVDGYTTQVQILSEKGKAVTEEAIAEMLDGIGNSLAQNVLPIVDTFRKAGEDSFDTLSRLNSEFVALKQGAINLGASVIDAKNLISSLGIDTRTAYLAAAGGADQFLSDTAKFSENFLTEAERMAPAIKFVEDGLTSLGIAADITKDQFGDLIQTLLQSASDAEKSIGALLLRNQDIFLAVNEYKESLKQVPESIRNSAGEIRDASAGRAAAESISEGLKQRNADKFTASLQLQQNTLSVINAGLEKLLNFANSVKEATNSIAPQGVGDARSNVLGSIKFSKRNGVRGVNLDKIDSNSLATLANQSSAGFTNRLDFERARAQNLNILSLLNQAVNKSIQAVREDAKATTRSNLFPSFDVGGIVPKTGLALVHKNERIINPQQNEAIVNLLQQLIVAMQATGNYSKSTYDLFKNMTSNGTALNTKAAA